MNDLDFDWKREAEQFSGYDLSDFKKLRSYLSKKLGAVLGDVVVDGDDPRFLTLDSTNRIVKLYFAVDAGKVLGFEQSMSEMSDEDKEKMLVTAFLGKSKAMRMFEDEQMTNIKKLASRWTFKKDSPVVKDLRDKMPDSGKTIEDEYELLVRLSYLVDLPAERMELEAAMFGI